jgi:hypothetical protein
VPENAKEACFELCLGSLVLQKSLSGAAEYAGQFRPGIRGVDWHHRGGTCQGMSSVTSEKIPY